MMLQLAFEVFHSNQFSSLQCLCTDHSRAETHDFSSAMRTCGLCTSCVQAWNSGTGSTKWSLLIFPTTAHLIHCKRKNYETVFDVSDSLSTLRLDSTFWCCIVFQHIDVKRLFQAAENTQHGPSMRFSSVMASRGCIDQGTSGTSSGVVENFEWTMVENSSTNTEIVLRWYFWVLHFGFEFHVTRRSRRVWRRRG